MPSGTNVGTGYLQIVPSAEGIHGAVTKLFKGEAESAGKSSGMTIGKKLIAAIGTAGVGMAIKKAVDAGANIEQSWGGIQTMFKSNAGEMAKYAKNAYKEAGISANAYMENVTSFSASLIKGLHGDTAKAAKVANTAMKDMSDNANKFGTDIGSIQQAYQGFAKQNFTMLDNLKLGYGGTASEMARLINDTGVMGKSFTATAKNIKDVPFDKMIEAIHKTQEEMGVTGTTSKEASETISGSFGTMKASFTDFLGALTMSGSAGMEGFGFSVEETFRNMVSSAVTFGGNFGNAVARLFNNAVTLIAQSGPKMALEGMNWISNLSKGFVSGIPDLVSHGLDLLDTFADNLTSSLPGMIAAGRDVLSNMITGITNAIPELVSRAPDIINKFANLINDNAPTLISYGAGLIVQLGRGLIQAIPVIVQNIPKILTAMWNVFTAFNWLSLGKQAVSMIGTGLKAAGQSLPAVLKSLGTKASTMFKNINWRAVGKSVVGFLKSSISSAAGNVASALKKVGSKGLSAFKSINWRSVGKAAINFIKSAISGAGGAIGSALKSVGKKGLNAFKNINWGSVGKAIISGIKNGIARGAGALYGSLKSVANSALKAAKKALGINSPSKVFAKQVGSSIPEGIAFGIEANTDSLTKTLNKLSDDAVATVGSVINLEGVAATYQTSGDVKTRHSTTDPSDALLEIIKLLELLLGKDQNIYLDRKKLVGALGPEIEMQLGGYLTRRKR